MSNLIYVLLLPARWPDVAEATVHRRHVKRPRRYTLSAREFNAFVKASNDTEILDGEFGLRLWPKRKGNQ